MVGVFGASLPDHPPPDRPPPDRPPPDRPKFRSFFSLSATVFHSFLPLLLVLFVAFWWCF